MIDFGFGVAFDRLSAADMPTLMRWRNAYAVRRWTRQFDLISDRDQYAWYDRLEGDKTISMYAVKFDDRLVGVAGLTSIDLINRRAEFSLYIDPEMRKNGYGKRALATLVEHGFKNYGLNSIWGESFDGNPAMRVFEGVGFKKEGIRRDFYFRDGRFIPAHLYSLLRSEWNSQAFLAQLSDSSSS